MKLAQNYLEMGATKLRRWQKEVKKRVVPIRPLWLLMYRFLSPSGRLSGLAMTHDFPVVLRNFIRFFCISVTRNYDQHGSKILWVGKINLNVLVILA